ncbi:MAG: hypothetical protein M0Z63_10205 [Actinomycetota bacterium]|nr:hypothetical protein [Actinomycetota bacterium]MDA8280773.1 hypothetical protein [Actinomycetota bacterium]
MPTPGRSMPFLALGTLTALSAGALGLSLATAAPVAPRQLHLAAASTAAASRLAMHETIAVVRGGRAVPLQTVDEQYQAPDRIQAERGGTVERIIGTHSYVSTDGGRTWSVVPQPVKVQLAVSVLLAPLRFLQQATTVTASAGQQRFSFTSSLAAFASALHLGLATNLPATRVDVVATVSGEFVSTVTARFPLTGKNYVLTVQYGQVDTLPALTQPPISAG